jgi:hypothetical protein
MCDCNYDDWAADQDTSWSGWLTLNFNLIAGMESSAEFTLHRKMQWSNPPRVHWRSPTGRPRSSPRQRCRYVPFINPHRFTLNGRLTATCVNLPHLQQVVSRTTATTLASPTLSLWKLETPTSSPTCSVSVAHGLGSNSQYHCRWRPFHCYLKQRCEDS